MKLMRFCISLVRSCHLNRPLKNKRFKMKMKLLIFAFLIVFVSPMMLAAQNESDGFTKLNQKDYREAKQIFTALLKTNPKNAAALFGLGEYYFYTGKTDSAKSCYQKGLDASSSYAGNYSGLGKISYKTAPVEAEAYFKDAIKKSKKEASAIVSIAKFFYEQSPKRLDEAKRYVNLAIGVDDKNGFTYFLNGLIELAKDNAKDASLQFDRAIYFDPNQLEAYLYQSNLMSRARNFTQAVDYVNKAIAVNPKFWPAYKSLGDLYYDKQNYADAAKNFAIYFKNVPADTDVTNYTYSLFFNKQLKEARELIDNLLKKNPNDYILLRLMGYIDYENKDYVNGKATMDKFFAIVPAEKVLNDDYSYYGKMLSASGSDSLAIINYQKALTKDSTQYQLYDEMSKSYNKLKKYDESLQFGSKYIKKKPNLTTADYYNLGTSYYKVGSILDVKVDSLKQLQYLQMADSLFKYVETNSPASYLGPFWRARVNSRIDKETTMGLAKPFYEKALGILVQDTAKNKSQLSEIYGYLGFYYYLKDDKPNSIDNWKKALEFDPGNKKAEEGLKFLESLKK